MTDNSARWPAKTADNSSYHFQNLRIICRICRFRRNSRKYPQKRQAKTADNCNYLSCLCTCAFYFGSIPRKILSCLNYTRGKSRASKRRPFPRHPLTSSSRPFAPSGEQTSWTPLWFLIRNSLEIAPKALKTLDFLLKQSQRADRTCVWAGEKSWNKFERSKSESAQKKKPKQLEMNYLGFGFDVIMMVQNLG